MIKNMVYDLSMKKMPYKVRLPLSIGLFLISIIGVVLSIVLSVNLKQPWLASITVVSVVLFVFSIVLFPLTKPNGTPTVEKKPKNEKLKPYKQKEPKKPFISEKEWEEIDEEDEECMYIDEDD